MHRAAYGRRKRRSWSGSVDFLEVLQLCSHSVIGWPDAHPGPFGLRSIQMAAI